MNKPPVMLGIRLQGPDQALLPLEKPRRLGAAEGFAPAELELVPCGPGAVLCSTHPLQLGTATLPARSRRLLLPGETVALGPQSLTLEREAGPAPSTRLLARALLGGTKAGSLGAELPRLIWLTGPDLGREVSIPEGATFIGRGEGCAARVQDPCCSRVHAKIVRAAGAVRLVGLGSANPLRVDGEPLTEGRTLQGGETLRIGKTLLRVELAPSALPPPEPVPAPAPAAEAPPAPVAHPEPLEPPARHPRLTLHERLMLGVAAAAVLAGGMLVGWAVR